MIVSIPSETVLPSVYFFNTFFMKKLNECGFDGVKRWARKINIFDFDLILVPIHLPDHWTLAVIFIKKRAIHYYDSLGGSDRACLETLRNYVYLYAKTRQSIPQPEEILNWKLKQHRAKIPQQVNYYDCGVFVCRFSYILSRGLKINTHSFDSRSMVVEYRLALKEQILTKQ